MIYLQAILVLFAIVDPIGNIPILVHAGQQVPDGQSRKAYNTAILVAVCILLIFSFAGELVLTKVFHIQIHDLKIAGGILLLIIAIDHLVFGTLRRSVSVNQQASPYEIGCVPLACPLLAGPGAMVTSLNIWQQSGPTAAVIAIAVVFSILWLITRFIERVQQILGRLFCIVFSKVMCMFIAAIGVSMIMSALKFYFTS
jgi:multiple antibiotic resistance protein